MVDELHPSWHGQLSHGYLRACIGPAGLNLPDCIWFETVNNFLTIETLYIRRLALTLAVLSVRLAGRLPS
jgi:hypothetical protein